MPDSSVSLQWILIAVVVFVMIATAIFLLARPRSQKKGTQVTVSEDRLQKAAEMIQGDESLTDAMTDAPASRLLDWAMGKSKQIAEQTASMDDATAQEHLDAKLQVLRRVVRQINKAVGSVSEGVAEDAGPAMEKALAAASEVGVLTPQAADVNTIVESIRALPPEDALAVILTYIDKGESHGEAAQ